MNSSAVHFGLLASIYYYQFDSTFETHALGPQKLGPAGLIYSATCYSVPTIYIPFPEVV
jgi:hypothetical protein